MSKCYVTNLLSKASKEIDIEVLNGSTQQLSLARIIKAEVRYLNMHGKNDCDETTIANISNRLAKLLLSSKVRREKHLLFVRYLRCSHYLFSQALRIQDIYVH